MCQPILLICRNLVRRTFGNGGLTLRRTAYVTESGMQGWYWKEDGLGANVTQFLDGKLYMRN
jgi:hypothetical protein